jgi:hypothetical protein
VARVCDFGKNDTTFFTRTHLGYILHPGEHKEGMLPCETVTLCASFLYTWATSCTWEGTRKCSLTGCGARCRSSPRYVPRRMLPCTPVRAGACRSAW